jgi:hypothetical protein
MSVMVPAATGTIARGGLAGQVCAVASKQISASVSADAGIKRNGFMTVLPLQQALEDDGRCEADTSNT